jgi:hypothetical protein
MKASYVIALIGLALSLSGCRSGSSGVSGNIKLSQNIELVRMTSQTEKKYELKAGEYKSVATIQKKSLILKVTDQVKNPSFKFLVPSTVKLPHGSGEFTLTSAQSGQPVDLHAKVEQTITKGKVIKDWESCQRAGENNQVVCTPQGCFPSGGIGGGTGNRYSTYRNILTETDYEVDLLKDSANIGTFTAHDEDVEKSYIHQGPCM